MFLPNYGFHRGRLIFVIHLIAFVRVPSDIIQTRSPFEINPHKAIDEISL